jgi:hypothetical protein
MCGGEAAVTISQRSVSDYGPNSRPPSRSIIPSAYADDTDFLFITRAKP